MTPSIDAYLNAHLKSIDLSDRLDSMLGVITQLREHKRELIPINHEDGSWSTLDYTKPFESNSISGILPSTKNKLFDVKRWPSGPDIVCLLQYIRQASVDEWAAWEKLNLKEQRLLQPPLTKLT